MSVCISVCVSVCLYFCVHMSLCLCLCVYVCLYMCVSVCLHLSVSLCVSMSLGVYVCLCVCVGVCHPVSWPPLSRGRSLRSIPAHATPPPFPRAGGGERRLLLRRLGAGLHCPGTSLLSCLWSLALDATWSAPP